MPDQHPVSLHTRESGPGIAPVHDTTVHATTVARGPFAALLRGPSGSGKSDLALRFLCSDNAWPFPALTTRSPPVHRLVADDYTYIARSGDRLMVTCPPTIAGRIEVRGLGIIEILSLEIARLALVVDLAPPGTIERMPDPDARLDVHGIAIAYLRLAPFEHSAPVKLAVALEQAGRRLATQP